METEQIQILMDQNKRQDEKLQNITNQLDIDRRDIDQIRIEQGTIKDQLNAILNQLTDFKQETRQLVEDTIKAETPKAVNKSVAKEIRLLSKNNPKKEIKGRLTLLERLKKLFI